MRLSDGERELLYDKLSRHVADGRITLEELERRVALIADAQTRADAAEVMADLPPLPAADPSVERQWRWGRRYGDADAVSPDWQATNERFRDPGTKRVMRVWVDSAGGRHYVADDEL
jgi:hypothetical protein